VLHPTKCQALKGDYKTGKRLNMKKVIPFIASNYKKDKIWLRRTLPSKRTYQIMIALDNSLSMRENNVDNSALQSLLAIVLALQKMEVGTSHF
jgi:midasin